MSTQNLTVDQLPQAPLPLDPSVLVPVHVSGVLRRVAIADLVALVEAQQGTLDPVTWAVATSDQTLIVGKSYLSDASATARILALPAAILPGQQFRVSSVGGQTTIASSGLVIAGVGAGNDLVLAAGQGATLVARTTTDLEIVQWQV